MPPHSDFILLSGESSELMPRSMACCWLTACHTPQGSQQKSVNPTNVQQSDWTGLVVAIAAADNASVPYLEDVFMSAICRLTTVAALLMHLCFGCSLHHAAACGHHDHDGCQNACFAVVATSNDDAATRCTDSCFWHRCFDDVLDLSTYRAFSASAV